MFSLYSDTPEFFNDLCDEIKLFVDVWDISKQEQAQQTSDGCLLHHFFWCENNLWYSNANYWIDGVLQASGKKVCAMPNHGNALYIKKIKKRLVKQNIYEVLKEYYKKQPPWGSLTGIRPTKLLRELEREEGAFYAQDSFRRDFDVSEEKLALAQRICENQRTMIEEIKDESIDIYIGIPFCASRCRYCSFVSSDLNNAMLLKEDYLTSLEQELKQCNKLWEKKEIRSIYIGGGTPTSLLEGELETLLDTVITLFPKYREFTVEAGRPDTITHKKLELLKQAGVGRISINPQTTNEKTLNNIGRKHTVKEFFDAFYLAKQVGFEVINTDIILGLPGESMKDVEKTLGDLLTLEPENITVHTLALKRASSFVVDQQEILHAKDIEEMVLYSQNVLLQNQYEPYYLYRQKYMSGNLENVGFSKHDKFCVYNVDIMEEICSILAFGAGAISKNVFSHENRLERAANVKDIKNYISRTNEMIARKEKLFLSE